MALLVLSWALTYLILILTGLTTPATALCTSFTPKGPAYTRLAHSQAVRITHPVHCAAGTHGVHPCGENQCSPVISPRLNNYTYANRAPVSRFFSFPLPAHGFTNLSLSGDQDFIYAIASRALYRMVNKDNEYAMSHRHRIESSMMGCYGNNGLYSQRFCVDSGRTAYYAVAPLMQCLDGVLSGCGPHIVGIGHAPGLKDGTPVQVCGPVNKRLRSPWLDMPQFQLLTVYVSDAEADRLRADGLFVPNHDDCMRAKAAFSHPDQRHTVVGGASKLDFESRVWWSGLLTSLLILFT